MCVCLQGSGKLQGYDIDLELSGPLWTYWRKQNVRNTSLLNYSHPVCVCVCQILWSMISVVITTKVDNDLIISLRSFKVLSPNIVTVRQCLLQGNSIDLKPPQRSKHSLKHPCVYMMCVCMCVFNYVCLGCVCLYVCV